MRNLLLFLIIFLGLAAWLVPVGDGYLFKMQFDNYIYQLQALAGKDKSIQIQVNEYHIGWLQSVASVQVTIKPETHVSSLNLQPTMTFNFDMTIHHGPIVKINNQFMPALAWVEGYVEPPDALKRVIVLPDNQIVQFSSIIDFNNPDWKFNYTSPALTLGPLMKWDGLTGEFTTNMTGATITALKNTLHFKPINITMPAMRLDFHIAPIIDVLAMDLSKRTKTIITHNTELGAVNVTMSDKPLLQWKSLKFDSAYSNDDLMLSGKISSDLTDVQSVYLNDISPISFGKLTLDITDINRYGLKKFSSISTQDKQAVQDALMMMLSANSHLHLVLNLNTNLGQCAIDLTLSLKQKPANVNDFFDSLSIESHSRIHKKLLLSVLNNFYAAQNQPDTAESILAGWIQQNIVQAEGDDIELSINSSDTNPNSNAQKVILALKNLLLGTDTAAAAQASVNTTNAVTN